jgi:hypothetical protein
MANVFVVIQDIDMRATSVAAFVTISTDTGRKTDVEIVGTGVTPASNVTQLNAALVAAANAFATATWGVSTGGGDKTSLIGGFT